MDKKKDEKTIEYMKNFGPETKKCAHCGKEMFRAYWGDYAYKLRERESVASSPMLYFCGYNCMRTVEKEHIAKSQKKMAINEAIYYAKKRYKRKDAKIRYECLASSEENVFKYIFTGKDYVAEAVLYRYGSFEERTVICCSVQSGCPVGCSFCGTGSRFVRDLTYKEIFDQVYMIMQDKHITAAKIKKFQIMFMSMGEPMLNFENVELAIRMLNKVYPNAQLLLSTIAPQHESAWKSLLDLSKEIDKIGLQFSIHRSTDEERNKLIPFKNKFSLDAIRAYGREWCAATGCHPYLNYCVEGTLNSTEADVERLQAMFEPEVFCFTFSVVCSKDETMKDAGFRDLKYIRQFEQKFLEKGYNTRVFDPAGQDDIGGGCGQLWFVQKWLKEKAEAKKQ